MARNARHWTLVQCLPQPHRIHWFMPIELPARALPEDAMTMPVGGPRASTCWRSPPGRPATSTAPTASSCRRKRFTRRQDRMSDATLETYIRQLLESHRAPEVTVAWQGGEPTLMGLDFFAKAVDLVERYRRPGQCIQHTFQTNGVAAGRRVVRLLQGARFPGRPHRRRTARPARHLPRHRAAARARST